MSQSNSKFRVHGAITPPASIHLALGDIQGDLVSNVQN